MRKKIVAGNWKMNLKPSETAAFIQSFVGKFTSESQVVFCVPYTNLAAAVEATAGTNWAVAAQNMNENPNGAYTGEISAEQLKDLGVTYVVLGHSERRQYYNETDASVNAKTLAALANNLIPIVCVGEVLAEREADTTLQVVSQQTKAALAGVTAEQARGIVIAYEPVWAIGTGKVATNDQAEEVCKDIRELVAQLYDQDTADAILIQYGGSVNGANAAAIFAMPNIDGGLVGGASLKAEFADVVNG